MYLWAVLRKLMPVVGRGHGDTCGDGAEVRCDYVGGAVPAGHTAHYLHHLAAQLPAAPGEQVGPDDYLHVGGAAVEEAVGRFWRLGVGRML